MHRAGDMRVAVCALAVLVLGPAPAIADEAEVGAEVDPDRLRSFAYEPSVTALGQLLAPVNGWSADLYAGAAVLGVDTSELVLGVRAGTPGVADGCRFVDGEAAVQLGAGGTSASGTVGVCLYRAGKRDVMAPGLAVHVSGGYELRPELAAPRALLPRRYTGGRVRVEGSVFETTTRHLMGGLFMYRVDVDIVDQAGVRYTRFDGVLDGITLIPPRFVYGNSKMPDQIVAIDADELVILGLVLGGSWGPTHEAIVGGLSLGRLRGLRIHRGLALDAELRIGAGDVRDNTGPATGEPRPLIAEIMTPSGHLGLTGEVPAFAWSARLTREVRPAFDAAIALEDRLDGTVVLRRWLPGTTVSAFAARTGVYARPAATAAWTGGVAVARSFALSDHLSLAVRGEVARSWYAVLDAPLGDAMAPALAPAPAARLSAVLTGSVGR